jgi:regulator of sirC expression with transglutaminase-like and TPR domain
MSGPTDLLMFAHLLRQPDQALDLESTSLLLCEPEYPGLDIPGFVAKLDVMGELARIRLDFDRRCGPAPADRVLPILRLLFGELGFRGNVADYYDPRNSFLNEVIDRRTGNPISLAIVLMAVCRRAGVETFGISFPGHFLVGARRRDRTLAVVDPFDGRMVRRAELRALYESATGDPTDIDEHYLVPATRRQILVRVLNNLRAIYEVRGDQRRLRFVLERMSVLSPSEEVRSRLNALVADVTIAPRVSVN